MTEEQWSRLSMMAASSVGMIGAYRLWGHVVVTVGLTVYVVSYIAAMVEARAVKRQQSQDLGS